MNLKFKKLLCVLSMLWVAQLSIHAQTTKEVVEIKVPGTLQKVIDDLESSRFESLTIKGGLNAVDIAYLTSGKNKVAMIETLDLSDVTLIPSDESYKTIRVGSAPGGAYGYSYNIYYISNTYKTFTESRSNGLGGSNVYDHIFCNDLSGAFYGNSSFEKIILPKSLTNIGEYIFSGNSYNTTLKDVILPQNAKIIGKQAFKDCRSLEIVNLPSSLITIESQAFYYTAVRNMSLPSTVRKIGDGAFNGSAIKSINLDNVESIGKEAFAYAVNLECDINLNKLDTIQYGTFRGTNIASIILSPHLKIIGECAFNGTKNAYPKFKELIFPESLERIGSSAFSDCRNVTDVTIPNSIQQIGAYAFYGTPWIESIRSEDGITYIANIAYKYDSSYKHEGDTFSFREGTIAISDGFGYAFPNELKENIKTLQLPESLLEIGNEVFSGFKLLGEVKLPSSLKRIGQKAFSECPKFWCTLPKSLETLEYQAFYNCSTLSTVTLPENLRFIGGEVFSNSAVGTVYIYSRSLQYQLLNWELGVTKSIFGNHSSLKKAIIGPQVTRLYDNIFYNTSTLKTVEFEDPENSELAYIGENCFSGTSTLSAPLTFKNFPTKLTHIGKYAFGGCKFNSEPKLEFVKYLGSEAFTFCSGFESIVIPESVDTIGASVFGYCPDLRFVEYNAKNSFPLLEYRGTSFGGNYFKSAFIFERCDSLQAVTIGPKVNKIPYCMFIGCRELKEVTFRPRNISSRSTGEDAERLSIGESAFTGCLNLNDIHLLLGTDSIGAEAFSSTGLITINIPSSSHYLGNLVFDWCNSLNAIYFNSIEPPAFDGPLTNRERPFAQKLSIYVPEESYDLYQSQSDLWMYNVVGIPTSAIEDILSPQQKASIISVYDINGRLAFDRWINRTKGVYIIKMSDGSVRKVRR